MPSELQVQIVIRLCQPNSTKQSPLWSCTSCKKEKCWRNSRWILSLLPGHSYLTGMKCSNEWDKTLWIISLVNNWEAWWAHHVASLLEVRDQYLAFCHTSQLFFHVIMNDDTSVPEKFGLKRMDWSIIWFRCKSCSKFRDFRKHLKQKLSFSKNRTHMDHIYL